VIPLTPAATAASSAFRNGLRHTGSDLLRRTEIALGAVIRDGILAAIHQLVAEEGRAQTVMRSATLRAGGDRESASLVAVLGTDLAVEHRVAKAIQSA
jgi:hypothetical protein